MLHNKSSPRPQCLSTTTISLDHESAIWARFGRDTSDPCGVSCSSSRAEAQNCLKPPSFIYQVINAECQLPPFQVACLDCLRASWVSRKSIPREEWAICVTFVTQARKPHSVISNIVTGPDTRGENRPHILMKGHQLNVFLHMIAGSFCYVHLREYRLPPMQSLLLLVPNASSNHLPILYFFPHELSTDVVSGEVLKSPWRIQGRLQRGGRIYLRLEKRNLSDKQEAGRQADGTAKIVYMKARVSVDLFGNLSTPTWQLQHSETELRGCSVEGQLGHLSRSTLLKLPLYNRNMLFAQSGSLGSSGVCFSGGAGVGNN